MYWQVNKANVACSINRFYSQVTGDHMIVYIYHSWSTVLSGHVLTNMYYGSYLMGKQKNKYLYTQTHISPHLLWKRECEMACLNQSNKDITYTPWLYVSYWTFCILWSSMWHITCEKLHLNALADRQMDRQTDGQKDRQIDRSIDRINSYDSTDHLMHLNALVQLLFFHIDYLYLKKNKRKTVVPMDWDI